MRIEFKHDMGTLEGVITLRIPDELLEIVSRTSFDRLRSATTASEYFRFLGEAVAELEEAWRAHETKMLNAGATLVPLKG